MARENQGLQIALIISVMLTIILGVATFLCYRQYTDTAKSLKTAQDDARRYQRDADKAREEGSQLRRYLGAADSESIETLSKQFDEDMKKYGSAFSQEVQFYRPLMVKLFQTVQDRDGDLVKAKDDNQHLTDQYELREAGKDGQLKEFRDKFNQVTQELNSRTETFRKQRDQLTDDQNKIKDQLQNARKETADVVSKAEAKYLEQTAQLQKTRQMAKKLREENTVLTNPVMDTPDGEISLVNQRDGTAWINLGRVDNLNPLTTFAVYPADITDLGKGEKGQHRSNTNSQRSFGRGANIGRQQFRSDLARRQNPYSHLEPRRSAPFCLGRTNGRQRRPPKQSATGAQHHHHQRWRDRL